MTTETLSLAEARRIALAAQGFADPRPRGQITRRHLQRGLGRTQLLPLESVNVLARAHYLPLYARLLEDAAWGRRKALFEYWAHEASLLPLELQPLLRWRMARAERREGTWGRLKPFAGERRSYPTPQPSRRVTRQSVFLQCLARLAGRHGRVSKVKARLPAGGCRSQNGSPGAWLR